MNPQYPDLMVHSNGCPSHNFFPFIAKVARRSAALESELNDLQVAQLAVDILNKKYWYRLSLCEADFSGRARPAAKAAAENAAAYLGWTLKQDGPYMVRFYDENEVLIDF